MINLSTWNLSTPLGSQAVTIDTPQLVGGYKDKHFNCSEEAMTFWAPVTGSTTENAKYPRTELRETTADGGLCNWLCDSAHHFLRATLAVHQVPGSGKIVIGQIHCKGSNEPLLKVEYQYRKAQKNGDIVAKLRRSPEAEVEVITIAQGMPLDQRFKYSIHLSPAGALSINTCDQHWEVRLDPQWQGKQLYFKAGVYTQDNTGTDADGGKASFYELSIAHEKKS
ncbi:polysaccharide lyase family 7 protein [Pseudomonas sp. 3A(2025)]